MSDWIGELWRRFWFLLNRRQFEHDFDEEMRLHKELRQEEYRTTGLDQDAARYSTQRRFGNDTLLKEASREIWTLQSLEILMFDVRFGLRSFAKSRGFTFAALLILALGLGANASIFSVVNAILLRPLPYPDPNRLVTLFERDVLEAGGGPNVVALPNFLDWRAQTRSFDDMAAGRTNDFGLGAGRGFAPERVPGAIFTSSIFHVLGVQPAVGRSFREDEDRPGGPKVAVISYGLWERHFGRAPDILRQSIRLDDETFQIVGVMPQDFAYPRRDTQVWVPLRQVVSKAEASNRMAHAVYVVARLRQGVSMEPARAELDGIQHRIWLAYGKGLTGRGAAVFPLNDRMVGDSRTTLRVLFAAVGCVLLIGCVNVANLLLARGSQRQREIAIRAALGARWGRLVRQLLTESLLLATGGTAFGLLLASWLTAFFARQASSILFGRMDFEPPRTIQLDWWVFGFTAVLAIGAGIASGFAPALIAAKADLTTRLKDSSRSTTSGRGQNRFRYTLITAEVALSLMLLVSAGLLVRSLVALRSVHPGVRTDHLLTASLALPEVRYDKRLKVASFTRELLDRLKAVPGVRSAGIVSCLPVDGYCGDAAFQIEGKPTAPGQYRLALQRFASPDYFATVGIPIVSGRTFTNRDGMGFDEDHLRPSAVIISESLARKYWPNEDPVGKRIYYGLEEPVRFQVVGVCGDVIIHLDERPEPTMYHPIFDGTRAGFNVVVQTAATPDKLTSAIRAVVNHLDPNLPVSDVRTMEDILESSASQQKFTALVIGCFALVAMILAAVGLYGVLYYMVAQRTNEIGIRMVLGATSDEIRRLVLWQGMQPVIAGIVLGLAGALAATRFMESLLFGVRASDPSTFGTVTALLLIVALLACALPAFRATRIDPAVAMRTE